jgi:hypothetical protein
MYRQMFMSGIPGGLSFAGLMAAWPASGRRISVAMLDLPDAVECRLRAAWRGAVLLGYPIDLSQWNGRCTDVVIVPSGDVCARLVRDLAIRSRSRVVEVGAMSGCPAEAVAAWDIAGSTDFELIRRLVGLCRDGQADTPSPVAPAGRDRVADCGLPGLLAAQAPAGWIWLRRGERRIRVHRTLSRIQAASRDDLAEAARQSSASRWRLLLSPSPECAPGVETRLDLFLLEACLAAAPALPGLGDRQFRLVHWPDLDGREPEYAWVLAAMSLVLRQAPVGVDRIATQTGLRAERANAMVWALWASGTLACVPLPAAATGGRLML